jgi:hypothetical protein
LRSKNNIIAVLLEGGAEIDAKRDKGETVLWKAIRRYDGGEAVKQLLNAGAKVKTATELTEDDESFKCSLEENSIIVAILEAGINVDMDPMALDEKLGTLTFTNFSQSVKCPQGHHLQLRTPVDNGWACDRRHDVGGCKRGITDFNQTTGVTSFSCYACGYDLFDACYEQHKANAVTDIRAVAVEIGCPIISGQTEGDED